MSDTNQTATTGATADAGAKTDAAATTQTQQTQTATDQGASKDSIIAQAVTDAAKDKSATADAKDGKTTDAKTADADKAKDGEKKDGKDAKSVVPEKYEDFKLPEGVSIDKEKHEGFKALAKDLGLTQEGAQKLVDQHLNALKEAIDGPGKRWAELQTDWQKQVKDDSEIGGANFAGMKASVARAIDKFGTPGLRDALNLTGAGNNPDIVKFIARLSKASAEGTPVTGSPAKPPKSAAEILYPTQGKSE